MPRRKTETPPPETHPACAIPGCKEPGAYKAPRSRDALHDYQWLCLEHIRAFNLSWNYFKDMEADEIEAFMHDALTGHRPTWQREDHIRRKHREYRDALEEGMARFFNWDEASIRRASASKIPSKERKALRSLELEERCDAKKLKAHFRALVKRCHPDLHQGDRAAEEKFKEINAAYRYLLKLYEA